MLRPVFRNVKVLGFDFAGEVTAVGTNVTKYKPGDKVFGMVGREAGCHAEAVCCTEENLCTLPQKCSFEAASAMVTGGLTALQALRDIGKIQPGDNVLIIGASGGVGSVAVQLAKHTFGAKVTAMASNAHRGMLVELGADKTLAYDKEETPDAEEVFDIVFDVSGKYSPTDFKYRRIFISTLPSVKRALLKIVGKPNKMVIVKPHAADLAFLKEQIEKGNIAAHIAARFSLDKIADAHQALEKGGVAGKVVLSIIPEVSAPASTIQKAAKTPAKARTKKTAKKASKAKAAKAKPAKKAKSKKK